MEKVIGLFNEVSVKNASLLFRALNHNLRKKILHVLSQKEKTTVTEIYVELRLEQSVASQHLAILRKAGVVNTTKDGKFVYYSINYVRIEQISKNATELTTCSASKEGEVFLST